MTQPLFHPGELAAQALAGFVNREPPIRDHMPGQHRDFFALLAYLPIAAGREDGYPVATLLTGPPGFIASPDPQTLDIAAEPDPADPAAAAFVPGAAVGLLGIDLATRRRNRANGVLAGSAGGRTLVHVTQSFGNCPQYIQTRVWHDASTEPGPVVRFNTLDSAAKALIAEADTFFVASTSAHGVDISHRGGRPGFVAERDSVLTIPDFAGNRFFNTFGNFLLNPRAALLFADWTTGTLLHLLGRAEILWNESAGFIGAERLWRFHVEAGWRRVAALPLRWSFNQFSPGTLRTGGWNFRPAAGPLTGQSAIGSG